MTSDQKLSAAGAARLYLC